MAKGGSKGIEVARAVRSLQHWGGPPSGRIELLVRLRKLGKSSVEVARLLNASDSHIRNSLRAYDWMRANKTWRSFCLAEYGANLAAVLERMAAEAANPKTVKPKKKVEYRQSLADVLDGKGKAKTDVKPKAVKIRVNTSVLADMGMRAKKQREKEAATVAIKPKAKSKKASGKAA